MKTTNHSLPKAFVLNLSILGLCVVRNLAKHKVPVVGLCNTSDIGCYSRLCEKVVCPDGGESEDRLVDFLVEVGSRLSSPGVLFPTDDDGVLVVSRNRGRLEKFFKFAMPSENVIENVIYKENLQRIAEKHGIPTAKSYFPKKNDDVKAIGEEIKFPCIIKPSYSRGWRRSFMRDVVGFEKAVKINNYADLVEGYRRISSLDGSVVVQEFIDGGENFGLGSYVNSRLEPVAMVTAKKIRQAPVDFGTGTFLESVHEPKMVESGLCFLKQTGYWGLSELEFMRDPKSGEFKLIDFNARHWGWHSLSARYGVDFSYIAYSDLTRQRTPKLPPQENGVKWWFVEQDTYFAVRSILQGKLNIGKWLETLRGKREYADFCWRDPVPFIVSLMRFLSLHSRSLTNKAFKKAKLPISAA